MPAMRGGSSCPCRWAAGKHAANQISTCKSSCSARGTRPKPASQSSCPAPEPLVAPGHMLPPHHCEGRKAGLRHDGVAIVIIAVHVTCAPGKHATSALRPLGQPPPAAAGVVPLAGCWGATSSCAAS